VKRKIKRGTVFSNKKHICKIIYLGRQVISKRFRFHGQSRFDLYNNRENSFTMTAKSTRYRRSPFFPFLSRLVSHWYARFGVEGDSGKEMRVGGGRGGGFGKSECVGIFIGVAGTPRGWYEIA